MQAPWGGVRQRETGYGGYSSAGRAPDCGSGCRGFEPHYPPHTMAEGRGVRSGPCLTSILGCSQVVRHGTLTPAFAGSSPAIPASSEISLTAPLPAGRAAESCARRKIFSLPHEAKGRLRGAPIWGKVHLVSFPLLSPARLKDSGPGARWGVARPSSSVGRATPF